MNGAYSQYGQDWTYDPGINGFDDQVIKTNSGTVARTTDGIRVAAGSFNFTNLAVGGTNYLELKVPTVPTASDNRVWGIYSPTKGNREAAYFFVSGTNFYCRTYNYDGTVESTTVTWLSAWTNAFVRWEIKADASGVTFKANGYQLARHQTSFSHGVLSPFYVSNGNSDSLTFRLYELRGAQKVLFNETVFARGDTTTTTSTSTTTTSTSTTTTSTSVSASISTTVSTTTISTSTTTTSTSVTTTSTSITSTSTSITSTSTSRTTTVTTPGAFNQ